MSNNRNHLVGKLTTQNVAMKNYLSFKRMKSILFMMMMAQIIKGAQGLYFSPKLVKMHSNVGSKILISPNIGSKISISPNIGSKILISSNICSKISVLPNIGSKSLIS